jgi:hypothetical protein
VGESREANNMEEEKDSANGCNDDSDGNRADSHRYFDDLLVGISTITYQFQFFSMDLS